MTDKSTEELIRRAAFELFIEKGKKGTTMQAVADRAGVNKALVHYYFRNKDNLYELVAKEAAEIASRQIFAGFKPAGELRDVLFELVKRHIDFVRNNPRIFQFIVGEILSRNRDIARIFIKSLSAMGMHPWVYLESLLADAKRAGRIRNVDSLQLFADILSLNIFPVLVGPLFFDMREELTGTRQDEELFWDARAKHVAELIWSYISIDER